MEIVATAPASRAPSLPLSVPASRAPSVSLSRAHTPAFVPMDEVPSSPLSPAPSSIVDADVELSDFDVDDFLPPPVVSAPIAGPSRATSIARDEPVRVPPRKKARTEQSPAHTTTSKPKVKRSRTPIWTDSESEADAPPPPATPKSKSKPKKQTQSSPTAARTKPKAKRSRTPTFTDSESEADARPAPAPKKWTQYGSEATTTQTAAKSKARKRPRTVFSEDESESDGRVSPASASASAPVRAPVIAAAIPPPATMKRKEKQEKREKRPRVREPEEDVDVENTPVKPVGHLEAGKTQGKVRTQAQAQRPKTKSIAPKSATNIARPDLTSLVSVSASVDAKAKAKSKSRPGEDAHEDVQPDIQPAGKTGKRQREHDAAQLDDSRRPAAELDGADLDLAYDLPLPAAELEGMLVETLATARASSLATSALYSAVMAARPALREMALPVRKGRAHAATTTMTTEDERDADGDDGEKGEKGTKKKGRGRGADAASKRAWVPAIEGVLEAGWRRCGMFGKVVNQGTVSVISFESGLLRSVS